jgi:methyl-accepting chemotaxis protein
LESLGDSRTSAAVILTHKQLMQTAMQSLLGDKDLLGILIEDSEERPVFTAGQVPTSTSDAIFEIRRSVYADGDMLGTVRFFVSKAEILRLQSNAERQKELRSTEATQEIKAANQITAWATARRAVILFFVLLASTFVIAFKTIVLPVRKLEAAAEKFANGDLSTPFESNRGDELGGLGAALETMRSAIMAQYVAIERAAADACAVRVQSETSPSPKLSVAPPSSSTASTPIGAGMPLATPGAVA